MCDDTNMESIRMFAMSVQEGEVEELQYCLLPPDDFYCKYWEAK